MPTEGSTPPSETSADGSAMQSQAQKHEEEQAKKRPHHDVLLIRDEVESPGSRLERFRVDKISGVFQESRRGNKDPVKPHDEGYRPTMNLGSTGRAEAIPRGPILSALPLHPSPAASGGTTCYLVNAQNLNYTTTWTADEWNDRPGGPDGPDAEAYVRPDSFSLLIASPAGKVYYLEKKVGPDQQHIPVGVPGSYEFREVDLRYEAEIWTQLRNGCVIGSAMFEKRPGAGSRKEKIVPLVNIDSLTPRSTKQAQEKTT
jgi:hypothetical protein